MVLLRRNAAIVASKAARRQALSIRMVLTRRLLVGGVALPDWANDLSEVLAIASIVGCAYIVLIVTQLQRGLRRRRCGAAPPTTLLLVRAMCMIEAVLHLRHCVGEFNPEAKLKWCHIASFVAQAGLCGNTVFNGLIALDVLLTVRNPLSYRSDTYLLRYMALGFAASLLTGVVATLPGVIQDGDTSTSSYGACWVRVRWMPLFYVPLWCTMLFCTGVLCYFVLKKYRARRKGQTQKLSMRQRLV